MRQHQIISSQFSAADLPAGEQFDAWRQNIAVMFEVVDRREDPGGGFAASVNAFQFGETIVAVSDLEEQRFIRSTRRILSDQLDHIQISLFRTGGWECDTIAGHFHGGAGQVGVFDLAQQLVSDEPHSEMTSIILPRQSLEDRLPNVSELHGRSPSGPFAGVLADYCCLLGQRLPSLSGQDGDEIALATSDMIVACLKPSLDNIERARPHVDAILSRRAKRCIDQELKSMDLSADSIAALLGVSRRTLYRVFEPSGGIQKYIQGRRLDIVRAELVKHADRRTISAIAEEAGFTRMDHFSRVFKSRFGCSPAEVRAGEKDHANEDLLHTVVPFGGFAEWVRQLG